MLKTEKLKKQKEANEEGHALHEIGDRGRPDLNRELSGFQRFHVSTFQPLAHPAGIGHITI